MNDVDESEVEMNEHPNDESGVSPEFKKLQEKLAQAEAGHARALADYQNLIKQTQRERQEYVQYANAGLIEELLPVLDGLEMAALHLKDEGLIMVWKQLLGVFEHFNVVRIEPEPGEMFDPELHECIDLLDASKGKQGTVAEVSQVGYRWSTGGVLRHAKVKVFKKQETKQKENLDTV